MSERRLSGQAAARERMGRDQVAEHDDAAARDQVAARDNAAARDHAAAAGSPTGPLVPGKISLLYESRDKRLCGFEDAQGHITVVRASRLA